MVSGAGSLDSSSLSQMFPGFSSLYGGDNWKNPADAAMPDLDAIEGKMTPYYDPYIQAGRRSLGTLEEQYNQMLKDPASVQRLLGSGFKASDGYKFNVDEATRAANNAGASSGMAGSPAEQAELARVVHGYADQDYGEYYNRNASLFDRSLGGLDGINQMGYGASNELAQSIGNALMMKSKLKYSGAQNQNEHDEGGSGFDVGSMVTSLAPLLLL